MSGFQTVFSIPSRVLLLFVLGLPMSSATLARAALDAEPLRPPDTSSPRDTFRTFLTNANKGIEEGGRGAFGPKGIARLRRSVDTMDFSTTPDGDSWLVRILRVLLLQEVLSRIELPPMAEIPGDDEVGKSGITRWLVPNTPIEIERIKQGPRAGEFLFASDTVEKIYRLYRRSKYLPYRPGATPGVYESAIRADGTQFMRMIKLRNRLEPVNTSSPRATLDGFLDTINRAYSLVMKADAGLRTEPPTLSREEALEIEAKAAQLLKRATATLDLSQVAEALREDVGEGAVLQLKEILDRSLLPPLDSVPNARMVAAAREGTLGSFRREGGGLRWQVPSTGIEIVEVAKGEQQGQFLFSAGTVDRLGNDFEEVREIPYREAAFAGIESDYISPGVSKGFYEYFVSNPGYLVPRAHRLGRLIESLPEWLKPVYGGQTLWQWIGILLSLLASGWVAAFVTRRINRKSKRVARPRDSWLRLLVPITVAILVTTILRFLDQALKVTGSLLSTATLGGQAIVLAMAAWTVYLLCKAVAETVIASRRTGIKEESIDATMWRIGARIFGFLLGALILVRGTHLLGANLVPLIAGLGVGGLAVALAAREMLTDVFGTFIILADRPYRIGHWVVIGDKEGIVESVGIRSTRIRTFYDSVLCIPNSEAVSKVIDNMGMRTYRRVYTKIAIRQDTPPARIEAFLEGIKRIIQANPTTRKDAFNGVVPATVRAPLTAC